MRRQGFWAIIWVLIIFGVSHCGGSGGTTSSSSDSSSGGTSSTAIGSDFSSINLNDEGTSSTVSFESSDDSAVLMMYASRQTSSSSSFQVGSSSQITSAFLMQEPDHSEEDHNAQDETAMFHEFLRDVEQDLMEADNQEVEQQSSLVRFAVGDERTFKVLSSLSGSSVETVTATNRYENSDFIFYVDNRDASSLTDSDIETLAGQFAAIVDDERDLFGEESDVDSNGKFAVLFTRVVNGLGASAGGMVTGFFYAVDLFSSSQYPKSNEMEVFYTFVPDSSGTHGAAISKSFSMSNIYPGVLAHEFQHMISFNQHYFLNSGSAEVAWLGEALSHLAEDIYSLDSSGYMDTTGIENPSRVSSFLSNISNVCFLCGSNLSQRGGSYLFIRYLYEQAEMGNLSNVQDGADLIGKLLDTNLRGADNVINAVYGSSGEMSDFRQLLGLFGLTMYLSNTDVTTDNRFHFQGINLRSTQSDNRGTVLNGVSTQSPSSFPFTDSLSGTSFVYIEFTASDIQQNGGRFNLSFDSDGGFGGYLIQ